MLKYFIIGLGLFCVTSGLPQSVTQTSHTAETSESEGFARVISVSEYCPPGFRLENGRCISNQPQCEPGSVLINGMCYKQPGTSNCQSCGGCSMVSTVCPAGFQLVNGVCQQIQRPCTTNCGPPPPPPTLPPPPPPIIQCPPCPQCIQQPCPPCPQCPIQRPDPIILPPQPTPCCSNPGTCNIASPCQAASTLGNLYRRYRRSIKNCQPEKNSK